MKILFQHDGILPVREYGGIERIIYWHMQELSKKGHEVVLIGHKDSQVEQIGVELIPTIENWASLVPDNTDIIHLFYNHVPKLKIPTINTIQGNGKVGEVFCKNTIFVSQKHAYNHSSTEFIYNGINLEEYPFEKNHTSSNWNDFLFLAKGSWKVKNLKHCIKACKAAKKHLHIAGGKAILPSKYNTSYGMVGGDKKVQILKKCDALLFPVRWPEPFGIAIIEAMAFGLPVIGSPYGSLPELIQENVGAIVNNYQELLSILKNPPRKYNSQEIRNYVEEHYSIEKHTEKYLEKYKQVIGNEYLNQEAPTFRTNIPEANSLLPF
jgi:glycosyltransferase involved in cell wall biosynthesis